MSEAFQVNGETLIRVKGMGELADPDNSSLPKLWDLGLADGQVFVSPRFYHRDMHCDDFGPDVPPDVLWMLSEVTITMTLVWFDDDVLQACVAESMAGGAAQAGVMVAAGTPMGGGVPRLTVGNHYISLNLMSPVLDKPWRFPTSYLAVQPMIYPVGTKRTLAQLSWRAIPYRSPLVSGGSLSSGGVSYSGVVYSPGEVKSAGAVLWDRTADTV